MVKFIILMLAATVYCLGTQMGTDAAIDGMAHVAGLYTRASADAMAISSSNQR